MKDHRLIYEHLTRKAFEVKNRKDLVCADADFFDLAGEEAIIAVMSVALFVLKKEIPAQREWVEAATTRLESIGAGSKEIYSLLEELPYELQ